MLETGAEAVPPVVVFDLGMVLVTPDDLLGQLAAVATGVAAGRAGSDGAGSDRAGSDRAGSDRAGSDGAGSDGAGFDRTGFERAYWAHRAAYDAGSSDTDFWGAVLRGAGWTPEPSLVTALTDADCRIWGDVTAAPRQLLSDLHTAGVRVGLLSNAPSAMGRYVRTLDWSRPFEHLVFSAEIGLLKPDAAIYEDVTARFSVEPAAVVFFDDRTDNVAGAAAHGWQAHVWAGVGDARYRLRAAGVLPPQNSPGADDSPAQGR